MSPFPVRSVLNGKSSVVGDTAAVPTVIVMRFEGRAHALKYYPGETLLETARRSGVPLNSGCEHGICGTCMVRIVAGRVRMQANSVLSDNEVASGLALACQSIPASNELEIDLSW
ncbi:MAG TPA: 2Fe-2S iron-sulfur cluster binding domain-containing protein [Candidatus Acidoferrum sp.]|nr:2Fe-2S iron-sulfur cluster binding domain-containing protein [Candidatus Acidoferrum sp.]